MCCLLKNTFQCTKSKVKVLSPLLLLLYYIYIISFILYPPCPQRCDRGRHSAPPRSSDGPVGYAGTAAHLPPLHHPLHCGDFNPAVNDRNNRSSYSGSGCITQQVTATTLNFISFLMRCKWRLPSFKATCLRTKRSKKLQLHHSLHFGVFCASRSLWKHFRGLSMCLLLLVFPVFMAYKISQFFHMDFWLLILVSSCMLTSLQVGRVALYVWSRG